MPLNPNRLNKLHTNSTGTDAQTLERLGYAGSEQALSIVAAEALRRTQLSDELCSTENHEASHENPLRSLGEFLAQNIHDEAKRTDFMGRWMDLWKATYDSQGNLVECRLVNQTTGEAKLNACLDISNMGLRGDLVIPSALQITSLDCSYNQLETLDVSNVDQLNTIDCQNNKLEYINLEGLKGLSEFNCRNNCLANLDIPYPVSLRKLDTRDNLLTYGFFNVMAVRLRSECERRF